MKFLSQPGIPTACFRHLSFGHRVPFVDPVHSCPLYLNSLVGSSWPNSQPSWGRCRLALIALPQHSHFGQLLNCTQRRDHRLLHSWFAALLSRSAMRRKEYLICSSQDFATTRSLNLRINVVSFTGQREVDLLYLLNDFPIVGLVGMSGTGKTALASLFFQARRDAYEKCSFLENVRSRHIEDVQRQLLFDLCGVVDWDKSKYSFRIRQCITTTRVLVVVDDAGCDEELSALQLSAFRDEKAVKKKSKAIVTGQDWQVLQDHVANPARVPVGALDEMDAMALFSFHAFDGAKVDRERQKLIHQLMVKDGRSHRNAEHHPNVEKAAREFEHVASEIVQECGGLPLSLHVGGNVLGKKKNSVGTAELLEMYKEALYKLRHAEAIGGGKANDKLWSRFWQRFHDLKTAEREMFIDFACFFDGVEETPSRLSISRDTFLNCFRVAEDWSPESDR